jgi:hypothetical protein
MLRCWHDRRWSDPDESHLAKINPGLVLHLFILRAQSWDVMGVFDIRGIGSLFLLADVTDPQR